MSENRFQFLIKKLIYKHIWDYVWSICLLGLFWIDCDIAQSERFIRENTALTKSSYAELSYSDFSCSTKLIAGCTWEIAGDRTASDLILGSFNIQISWCELKPSWENRQTIFRNSLVNFPLTFMKNPKISFNSRRTYGI